MLTPAGARYSAHASITHSGKFLRKLTTALGRTLVIRPGALGDALLTLPALNALYAAGAQPLTVLGTPPSWRFLPDTQNAVQILDFASAEWLGLFSNDSALSERAAALLAQTELAVAYLSGETSELARRLTHFGVKSVLVAEPPLERPVILTAAESPQLTQWNCVALPPRHASLCLLEPLRVLGASGSDKHEEIHLRLSLPEREHSEALRRQLGMRHLVALHPGSGGKNKCWPAAHFARLAELIFTELKMLPLIFFGPADDQARAEYAAAVSSKFPFVAYDNLPLRQVYALLTQCRLAVCNDSGPAHLAARATRTLALFGRTDPGAWAPIGRHVWTLQAPGGALAALSVESVFALCARIVETSGT